MIFPPTDGATCSSYRYPPTRKEAKGKGKNIKTAANRVYFEVQIESLSWYNGATNRHKPFLLADVKFLCAPSDSAALDIILFFSPYLRNVAKEVNEKATLILFCPPHTRVCFKLVLQNHSVIFR